MAESNNSQVTVRVGENGTEFYVELDAICNVSSFFRAALKGRFAEAADKKVQLPDHNDEAFGIIKRWLSGNLLEVDFKGLEWTLLCEFFVLVDYLGISSLKEPLVKSLLWKQCESRTTPVSCVPLVYEKTPPGSPLRRMWVDWIVKLPAPEIFESKEWVFPEEFMRDLAAAQMRDRKRIIEELEKANRAIDMRTMIDAEPAEWARALASPYRARFG